MKALLLVLVLALSGCVVDNVKNSSAIILQNSRNIAAIAKEIQSKHPKSANLDIEINCLICEKQAEMNYNECKKLLKSKSLATNLKELLPLIFFFFM